MMIIVYILANAVAILVADRIVPGFGFHGQFIDLVIASVTIGIINSFVKPIVKLLTFPIIILTLGIFSILINVFLLELAAALLRSITISGFWAALFAAVIISLTNNFILSLSKSEEE